MIKSPNTSDEICVSFSFQKASFSLGHIIYDEIEKKTVCTFYQKYSQIVLQYTILAQSKDLGSISISI